MLDKTPVSLTDPDFISVKRAASLIHVCSRSFYKYIADGVGPPVHYFGKNKRLARIRLSDFKEWAEQSLAPKPKGRK